MRNFHLALSLLAFCLLFPGCSYAASVADVPPLSLAPKDLLDEANSSGAQKNGDAVFLLNEEHWTFRADGTLHHSVHAAFQILSQQGVSNWSEMRFTWEPWREQRPAIKARTVTPDGVVHELDPNTISDAPAGDSAPQSFSDMRVIQCPLPSVTVGAVVEQFTENDETLLLGSMVFRTFLASSAPLRIARVLVDYPTNFPLRYKALLAPDLKTTKTTDSDTVHLVFESRNVEPAEEEPPLLPPDAPRYPSLIFSTAGSWGALAEKYSDIVDKQIADASLPNLRTAIPEHATREVTIAALTKRLHAEVRYTGIEFGSAAIVPARPEEVLKRGYGDCKDKASLLVAMLRAAGIPAYVAILNGGFSQDVDPDFPGMGMFNHAIVYVPGGGSTGSPAVWIDATSTYSQPGMLPGPDQGRLALIAAKGTTHLTRTPETPSTVTVEISTHEYTLPEYGPTRIVETNEGTGNIDAALRASTGPIDTDQGRKAMQEYVQKSYDTKSDISFDHPKAEDLNTPFRLRLTIPDSKSVMVTESGATISVAPAALLNALPRYFLYDDSQENAAKPKKRERTEDFQLPQAFITQNVYRIHLPSGFVLKKLPDNQDLSLGPVHLTAHYVDQKDTVVATLRLDSGKRRYTVAEATALKKAALDYLKTPEQTISIEPAGQADLEAGRIREAIQDFKTVSARLPDKPLYHVQISRALLAAGCGEQARTEARRATEIAPRSVLAWQNLGYVLERDLIGRPFKKGWDPEGAEAGYRKAMELDKDDLSTRQSLAELLEYDADGERYTSQKRLAVAIEIYHGLTEEQLGQARFINPFVFVLTYAGRFDELETWLAKLPAANEYLALREVALASTKGVDAAIADAGKSTSDTAQRTEVLERAGGMLSYLGRYPEAAALTEAGATGAADSAQVLARANVMRNLHHFDYSNLKPDTPENAVKLFLCFTISGDIDKVLAAYDPGALSATTQKQLREASERTPGIPGMGAANVNRSYMIDFALSTIKLTVDDNGHGGYRVKQFAPGAAVQETYLVHSGGEFKLLGTSMFPEGVGRRVIAELDKGQADSARKWLDWVREQVKSTGGDDPLAGPVFPHLWIKGASASDAQIRIAAASLVGSQEVLPGLREASAHAATDPKRDYIELAFLSAANSAQAWAEALPVAQALAERHPESATASVWVSVLLCALHRGPEAERFVDAWVNRDPDNVEAQRAYGQVLQSESKFKEAEVCARKLAESPNAGPQDWNDFGWTALLAGDLTPEKLDGVRHGVGSTNNPAILHTIASMAAELGKGSEAREEVLGAMTTWDLQEPNQECWYVFGRIAELYGVKDAAAAYYAKLKQPSDPRFENVSTFALAQKRLAVLR